LEIFQHRSGEGLEAVAILFQSFAAIEIALGFAVRFIGGGLKEVFVFGAGPEDGVGRDDPEGHALAAAGVLFFGHDEGQVGVRRMERPHMLGVPPSRPLHKDLIGWPMV
jgi:hypothetical protein